MPEKLPRPTRTLSPEQIEQIRQWAKSPETLRKIQESAELAEKVNKQLDQQRRVDPRSLREPIGAIMV